MNDDNGLMRKYTCYSEHYNPINEGMRIRVLFVAESPPEPKKNTLPYFYNSYSKVKGLWWHFNEVLYNGKMLDKNDFLERFRNDGYFLIDVFATRRELLDALKKDKENYEMITTISQRLFERIRNLEPEKVVFLGKRSAKLIAGCLPFGNTANVKKFKEFINASI